MKSLELVLNLYMCYIGSRGWFDLSTEEQGTYKTAKEKIVEQMAPARFVTLADLHRRCL